MHYKYQQLELKVGSKKL